MLAWTPNKSNTIRFVMIDAGGNEVTGLGSTFTVYVAKADGGFGVGAGTKSEVGLGWYQYVSTAGEASVKGPISVVVMGAGCIQQNLDFMVGVGGSGPSDDLPATYTTPNCVDGYSDMSVYSDDGAYADAY